MDLNTIWFILIAVLYIGFFILEGFDFGVGILLPFLGRTDRQRRVMINTIGPVWDGNEVWLLTAGGATFAAFPEWYATLFSGFYLPLLVILLALIVRGVALEFRSKDHNPDWRKLWDTCIFIGSLLPAILFGVAFANLVRGVPIDADMNYVGGFWNLINWYALLGGLAALSIFSLHGAIFLSLKTTGPVMERSKKAAWRIWPLAALLLALFLIGTYIETDIVTQLGINPGIAPIGAAMAILAAGYFVRIQRNGWAFILTSLTIILSVSTIFLVLYPRVMVSSLDPAYSLTIYNSSSTDYTLRIMTIVALTLVPLVLLYQGWSYWVFRKRISEDSTLEY
jgi:cytochrome d ubiquinol oxidase subunit II